MNKAFVKETEQDDEEQLPFVPLPAGGRNYLTRPGFEQLRNELLQLLDVERPKVVEAVSWAAKNGDRSENGDYIYGKRRLREIDRRVRFLSKRLEIATVVDVAEQTQRDQVFFGATVTFVNEQNQSTTITIVGIDEAQPLAGRISWVAPVSRALLKARVGDEVSFDSPNGRQMIEVIKIEYPQT
jgi:transcription elongation factor GreB